MAIQPLLLPAVRAGRRLRRHLHRFAVRLSTAISPRVRVTVLLTDIRARRSTERALCDGVRRIGDLLEAPFPADAIIAQLTLPGAESACSVTTAGGRVLVRLALSVNGARRSTDELVATLADQVLALAAKSSTAPPGPPLRRVVVLPADPLVPVPPASPAVRHAA